MRTLPPLSAIKVFEAAARHGNFTQAASELGMTQAAVSYQIRLLEQRLGLALFHRAKQRVKLTDAGRKTAPIVSAALDSLSDAFAGLVTDDQGVLTVSAAQTFATTWLAARLGAFQLAQPELAVRLTTDNRLIDFASEDVDVAVRIGHGPWPGLARHFLFRSHVTPICSPEFLVRHPLDRPEQLLNVPRISPDDGWWKKWFAELGLSLPDLAGPRSGIELDSQVTEMRAVTAGHGVAMMSPYFWTAELESGRLVQPFDHLLMSGTYYWLVYPEHKRLNRKIKAFREWMLGEVAASRGDAPEAVFAEPVDIS